ncbi:diguanylate cyclase/phosphodiesterase (GGDEF & EAL domains) with PAS/PAC sensor(s) [hydrothermal vent metagenome]|uniref:Diguanylate cyclase/phosphodiesterase (GGDEF & EAL domains) with PAS/PAC sensor(S) n=1 Tax=hydrothermal vent metagenome TaxID=652676 RepID=A0A3B1A7N8_9ZZZZ
MTKTHPKTLSIPIHILGMIFIFALMITLVLLGWYTNQKIVMLEKQSKLKTNVLAKQELNSTLTKIIKNSAMLAEKFSNWDETKQQLQNSTYYKYWQLNRAPKFDFAPAHFDNINLYNNKGKPLSDFNDTSMPFSVSLNKIEPYVIMDFDNAHLYQQANISSNNNIKATGFLILKIDLAKALKNTNFKYLDINKLKYKSRTTQFIPAKNINQYFETTAVTNSEFNILEELFNNTLIRISIASLLLFLSFIILSIKYLGFPLRDLAQQIDLVGKGSKLTFEKHHDSFIQIAEFEKVYKSLNHYHDKLYLSENELRESELRIRTVLETVPDAIITLNRNLKIISINSATEKLFGHKNAFLLQKNIDCLLSDDSKDKFHHALANNYFDSNLTQDEQKQQFIGQHKSGYTFDTQCSLTSIELFGEKSYLFIAKDITDRKEYETRLTHLANFDSLTGLSNRTLFHDRLEHAISQAKRNDSQLSLLFIDLDRFKPINDTYGHHIGDLLLTTVAMRIKNCIREGDTLSRLSGDEFTIILEGIELDEDAAKIADNIIHTLRKPYNLKGNELFNSASIGISSYPNDDADFNNLIKNADTAMYRAKELGGNQYQFFTMDLNYRAEERLTLENKLRFALDKDLFSIEYQPKINIKNNTLSGIEALMRFTDPELGRIPPVSFIPLLEETGLINRAGEWIIRKACSQYMQWRQSGFPDLRMSINLSVYQFKEDKLVDNIFKIISDTKINPHNLEFEITESLLVENIEETTQALNRLHQKGIKISIDDFGTGYSSLAYLKKFPIDILKIDRSFVNDITTNEDDAIIVETIIAMARSLKLSITAEGVESVHQLNFLKERDCDEVQGYYFSKPLTSKQLIDFVKSESWKKIK